MLPKSVCVFCGSKCGADPAFRAAAEEFGQELAKRNLRLVFGGGQVGLMGVIADAALAAGGLVEGVIPKPLATKELLHTRATRMHVVATMHERKAKMVELAEAFVALPGGYGTFEELLEVITWAQLGIHQRPIGLLNTSGFFDPLVALVDSAIVQGFIKQRHRELFIVESTPAALLDRLEAHQMPPVTKWIDREQT